MHKCAVPVRIHRTCTSTLYPWESTANAVALYSRKESTAEKFSLTHGTSTRARYQEEYARQNPSAVSIESRAQDVVCVRKGSEERNRCRWADAGSKPVFALFCVRMSHTWIMGENSEVHGTTHTTIFWSLSLWTQYGRTLQAVLCAHPEWRPLLPMRGAYFSWGIQPALTCSCGHGQRVEACSSCDSSAASKAGVGRGSGLVDRSTWAPRRGERRSLAWTLRQRQPFCSPLDLTDRRTFSILL